MTMDATTWRNAAFGASVKERLSYSQDAEGEPAVTWRDLAVDD